MRRLYNLVRWLPADSALHRAMDPDGAGTGWTLTDSLLATLIEVVDVNNVILLNVYSKKGQQVRDPVQIPRPGRGLRSPRTMEDSPVSNSERLLNFMIEGGSPIHVRGDHD